MLALKRTVVVALIILGVSQAGSADVVFEEAGWKITMPSWVGSPTGAVVVRDTSPGIPDDVLVLEIGKIFKGQPGQFGEMPSIVMAFEQTDDSAPDKIVINDEAVMNLMTVDWVDFHFILLGELASFNRGETFPSGVGGDPALDFDIAPFTEYSWYENPQAATEELALEGGTVPAGDTFFPGTPNGSLVIDVDLSGQEFATFMFKEVPSVPEPASLFVLTVGATVLAARRRKR